MTDPTIIELTTLSDIEGAKAKWWRKHFARMTIEELAERTGYTTSEIARFERGYDLSGNGFSVEDWRKYRLACAGTTVEFFWDRGPQNAPPSQLGGQP